MIAYTIAAARNSALFSRVLVSTEDPEIADVSRSYGGEVVERPPELADDTVTVVDVALHALEFAMRSGTRPAALCNLMPNCPLRCSGDIALQWAAFTPARSFQISAVPFRGVYPQWSLALGADGEGRWFFGEALKPSQQLPRLVCPTGAVWWVRVDELLKQRRFYGDPFHVEPMDADRGLDIDTDEDLVLADLLVRGLRERDRSDPLEPLKPTPRSLA
jgi:CMP-N-acetylneuraminic acid synthetase